MKKKHIILVTTWFPPANSVAVNRMEALVRYIDKDVFEIDVVTLKSEGDPFEMEGVTVHYLDNDMLFKKATFLKPVPYLIHKAKALYNIILLTFQKNEFRAWQKRAIAKVRTLLDKYGEETTVISSYEPIAAHLVPLQLKKEGRKFHWVPDCRDEIAQNPSIVKSLRRFYRQAESDVLAHADLLTTVSAPILEGFRSNSANDALQFAEIRNGYDFEVDKTALFNEVFTMTTVGTFYGKRQPYTLFQALEQFLRKNKEAKVRLRLIGAGHSVLIPAGLRDWVETTGKIPHLEAIQCMQQADALVLTLPKVEQKGVYSGKLFEYLGCHRPIIATVDPDDVAAQLIRECRAGFIADFDCVDDIEKAIEDAYRLWAEKKTLPYNDELIAKHHRKNQIGILNNLIINMFYK